MVAMVLKARIRARSGLEPRFCQRPREEERKSPEEPLGLEMTVESPPSVRSGLEGPPTRTGSLSLDSLNRTPSRLCLPPNGRILPPCASCSRCRRRPFFKKTIN